MNHSILLQPSEPCLLALDIFDVSTREGSNAFPFEQSRLEQVLKIQSNLQPKSLRAWYRYESVIEVTLAVWWC